MADIYDLVGDSKATKGGTPISDGEYTLMVERLMVKDLYKGTCFIAEFQVVESSSVYVDDKVRLPDELGKELKPIPAGGKCSYVLNLTDSNTKKTAPGNMKAFLLALAGYDEDKVDPAEFKQIMRAACNQDTQPLRGAYVKDTTYRKTIQSGVNAGKPFTAHRWVHVEQSDEEIAARKKALDAVPVAAAA